MRSKRVAVLMGGWSAEREVSLSSGKSVVKALEKLGHTVSIIDVTQDLVSFITALTHIKPDIVFNALHGKGGEDGIIQGILDVLEVAYTHSGVLTSAVAMDKVVSRQIFKAANLTVPPSLVVSFASFKQQHPFDFPYVVKPINEGSSVGVYMVHSEEDKDYVLKNWVYGPTLLVEKFIKGREIQVAMKGDTPIGAIEICPLNSFYDYEAKYTEGKATHLMPAPLPETIYKFVLSIAKKAHQALGCHGISRVDFIYEEESNIFYLLELNTQPGFTSLSLVPEIAAHYGISFEELVQWILTEAENRFLSNQGEESFTPVKKVAG